MKRTRKPLSVRRAEAAGCNATRPSRYGKGSRTPDQERSLARLPYAEQQDRECRIILHTLRIWNEIHKIEAKRVRDKRRGKARKVSILSPTAQELWARSVLEGLKRLPGRREECHAPTVSVDPPGLAPGNDG